jgi:CHAT domain-containing protein
MQTKMIWLVCAVFHLSGLFGQPILKKKETGPEPLDTGLMSQLALVRDRKNAVAHLSGYLTSQSNPNAKELAASWLDLAILLASSDSIKKSREAFTHYLSSSLGQPESPSFKANRLLCQSLYLSSLESGNQSADSLIASIAIRPVSGTINRILLADSYGLLARLYKKSGDLFESSRNFERSISLNQKLGRDEFLADDLTDMSSVLSTINSFDGRADSVLFKALVIYTRIGSLWKQAQVYNELGVLMIRRGIINESLKNFKQSLQLKQKIIGLNKQEFIKLYNNIGTCYQYLEKTDSVSFYVSRAILCAEESGQNPAQYYANLGIYYGRRKEYTQAIVQFQKALKCLDTTCSLTDFSTNPRIKNKVTPNVADFTAFKALTLHRRYHQLHNPDDLTNGLRTFIVALDMMDELRFMYSFESKPYLSSEAKIHFFNALDMALDLYKLTGEKKYLEQAFQLSERNKAATLNEFLRTNKAREYIGSVAPWITHEDSIKQLINKTESSLIKNSAGTNSDPDTAMLLQTRLSNLKDELKLIGITARRENPEYFKIVYSNAGYLPEDVQELINPGEALIDYTVLRDVNLSLDVMIVIVLTHDTLYTYRDTLPGSFREDLRAFRGSITSYVDSKVFQDFARLSNLMYGYLFAPIEKFNKISRLIILPDEELGYLPFEAFVCDTIKPKGSDFRKLSYLNRKYEISYISSHEQLYQFRKNPVKRPKSVVYAFAPFASSGAIIDSLDLLPLENSGKEIKFVSKYFKTKIFKDKEAGEQSLRRAFQKESVISLSTHGMMDPAQPMQSRLMLNPSEPDGSLFLFEMMSLKIKSSLVILNACNTGTGKLQVGEGILSMARGFQFAGVPSVITTLWPVDDRSSATITKLFFQYLHAGMDQREALMKARNAYVDQSSKATGAPYFWAGQVLIGDPGSISIQHRVNPLIILIPLILAAIILIFCLAFHKKVR